MIVSQRVYCIMHLRSDTSTCLIRTSTVSELKNIFCRFAKNTIASLNTSWDHLAITLLKEILDDWRQTSSVIELSSPKLVSSPLGYVLSRMPFLQYSWYPFLHCTFSDNTTGYMLISQSTTVQADIVTNLKRGSNSFPFDWMLINLLALPLARCA